MTEAVVSVALKTIGALLLEECKFLHGVGGAVKELQLQLTETKCLLSDADTKQHQSKIVRNWMVQIRDLTYRAEDAIAAHAVGSSSRYQLGREIMDITAALATVSNSLQNYGITTDGAQATDNLSWRTTFPDIHMEDCFVGKEDELKALVSLLVDDKQHRVISVCGMGGIGKTTIAKNAYNHKIVVDFFQSSAWVCITQQCRIRSVLEDVLKQLNPERVEGVSSLSDTQLIQQLCQIQSAKRCLIVVDDIWETSQWNGLKHAFLVHNLKSKILITTRKLDVAKIGLPIEVGLLKLDDAWELLKKKALPRRNIPDFALQKSICIIGKEMVQKCGCLPLAITLLGGVLSGKKSMAEWELVNKNMDAYLYRGEEHHGKAKQLDAVLNLSYDDLPYYLKLCFLYLGVLREDESINACDLYRVWIAQGMISNENSRGNEASSMEVAELYLSELASRSIVQVEVNHGILTKKYKSCKLHDVVRELCLSMGQKEYYRVQTLEYEGGRFSAFVDDALSCIKRHLVIHFKTELQLDDELRIIGEDDNSKHLRSLHLHNGIKGRTRIEFPCKVDFRKFKSLRSLAFEGFKFVGGKLPRGITRLVHLRNLRFRNCEIDELSSSIGNLVYLEILDLLASHSTRIPNVLKKMFRLKQLLLPYYDTVRMGNYRLGLDKGLDQLESLMGFNSSVHKNSCVARMKKLQHFSAYVYDNGSYSAILNAIATNRNKLVFTFVIVEEGCQITSTELMQALTCRNLYGLAIYVHLGKLLTECRSYIICSNLVFLFLANCRIEEDPMEILGNLPSLRELSFFSRSFVGEKMTCPAFSFPRLKLFELIDLAELSEWRVDREAMPLLSEIDIYRCHNMETVPQGLRGISTLQKLIIKGMPKLGRRVSPSGGDGGGEGEGEDFHKVRHVCSIIIID